MVEQFEIGTPVRADGGRNGMRTGIIAGVTAVVIGGAAFGGWQLQQFLSGATRSRRTSCPRARSRSPASTSTREPARSSRPTSC